MTLRGRFTLALALAALVPISVAAVVTRHFIVQADRARYADTRKFVDDIVRARVTTLSASVENVARTFSNPSHPFIDRPLSEYTNEQLSQMKNDLRRFASQQMDGYDLQLLTVTDPENKVLLTPHYDDRADDHYPELRAIAESTHGQAYFAFEEVRNGATHQTVLVAEATRIARGQLDDATRSAPVFTVSVGKLVTQELFADLRGRGDVDARLVLADGRIWIPPKSDSWRRLTADPPSRTPLRGRDGQALAFIEVAVADLDREAVLRNVTWTSAALALGALGIVVLIGLLVARRTARDLDRLVDGALAAARGDLEHRVPVRSADEVGAVANAFNLMMEDLRTSKDRLVIAERIAAWQDIARRLAHEIKNPLTPIQMAMDTLRKTWIKQHPKFGEILEESTTTVLQEADRLKHIVAEFSDFARMPKPELGTIDLNEVVRSAMALYQGAVPVEVELDPALPPIDADKNQLNQVVLNLVENARDAIHDRSDGRIVVRTKLAVDRALLVIEDNGPGVPPDLKDKVFAPYFTTKHGKGGTGLGLAIVHRIIADHGGRVTITDAGGGGARFVIELPLQSGTALLASTRR
ncbi:MAG: PAS domain-containing sensor histidine kinase [Kofleriaceae bacterium]